MPSWYFVHQTNPNDRIGGGGCLATGRGKGEDCKGPWIEFHRTSTEHDASPFSAICSRHLAEVADQWSDQEQLAAGDELPRTGRDQVSRGTVERGGTVL